MRLIDADTLIDELEKIEIPGTTTYHTLSDGSYDVDVEDACMGAAEVYGIIDSQYAFEWLSPQEELPDNGRMVLASYNWDGIYVTGQAYWDGHIWIFGNQILKRKDDVLGWMEMPDFDPKFINRIYNGKQEVRYKKK